MESGQAAVPRSITTTPAEVLASRMARGPSSPAARPSVNAAAAVSPAPLTSITDCEPAGRIVTPCGSFREKSAMPRLPMVTRSHSGS